MVDKYDEEIAELTKEITANPEVIYDHWIKATPLFDFCGGEYCGCLTQIRGGGYTAMTEELTKAIRNDERIPRRPMDINLETLPIFAEWQRRLDKELGRVSNA